ncbi:MAG: response regulator [Nitrospirae bacterium]|nr:response regulator [Nitrospirota bacterium]
MTNHKILILDDEQVVIDAIKKHLKEYGHKLFSAKNGKDGLKLYYEVSPILIILDLKMPVMDGVEFLEHIKLTPADPCTVIVLTGHGTDEDMERCFDLGVSSFLHKPFSLYELKGMVKHSIALKQVEGNLKTELAERTKMEEELWKYRYLLEEIVDKRTSELKHMNEVLQKEVTERISAEEKLKHSLGEKEVLLREIHHRVKNNLQIVSSLLDLQTKYIKEPATLEMFRDSQSRLKTMALIHEKLYQSDDMARIDFSKYIVNLLNHIYHSYCLNVGAISMETQIDEVFIGVDTAIPCGLIINELVSNSFKHAFKNEGKGTVGIKLKEIADGKFKLSISDDGIGFPESVDITKAQSLGLRLVNALVVDQLEGTLEFSGHSGARFDITFGEIKYVKRG